jgi:hypothetical protein
MSSCGVSCCTCFPEASFAFGTSDSSPIAGVPSPCHSASPCSDRQPKPSKKLLPLVRAIFGFAPIAVGRCASSNDSRLPRFNYVVGASALSGLLRPFAQQTPPPHSVSSSKIGQLTSSTTFFPSKSSVLLPSANSARRHPHTPDHSFPIDARVCRNHGRPPSNGSKSAAAFTCRSWLMLNVPSKTGTRS